MCVQDFAVSTVPVCGGARLKNICSMGGPDTIVFSNSEGAKKTLRVSNFTESLARDTSAQFAPCHTITPKSSAELLYDRFTIKRKH